MTRCSPLCSRVKVKEKEKQKEAKRVVTLEKEKIVRQAINDKEDQGRKKEIEKDHRKIKEMVPKRFLKQKKIFGKVESERMLTRKTWDHAINLKEMFKL